jgi:hypothetical protein
MNDRYLIETSATDGYLLEDGGGVLILEVYGAAFMLASPNGIMPEGAVMPQSPGGLSTGSTMSASSGPRLVER